MYPCLFRLIDSCPCINTQISRFTIGLPTYLPIIPTHSQSTSAHSQTRTMSTEEEAHSPISPASASSRRQSRQPPAQHLHREIWDANARTWDAAIGTTGNSFYRHLISPTALSLLCPLPEEKILELACGNGIFARKLAELGSQVWATDFSENMVKIARERTGGEAGRRVRYMRLDVTNEWELDGLVALAGRHLGFDGVVCRSSLLIQGGGWGVSGG